MVLAGEAHDGMMGVTRHTPQVRIPETAPCVICMRLTYYTDFMRKAHAPS